MLPTGYDLAAFLVDAQAVTALFGVVVTILAALWGGGRLLGIAKRIF
jgi:hypothetical protein